MSRTQNRTVAGIAVAVLALTLVACGSDDDAADTTEAPAATDAPAATAPVASDAPAATDAPVETEAPADTDAPAGTDAPADTEPDTTLPISEEPLRIGFLPPSLEIPAFQGLWHGLEGYGGGRYGDTVVAVDAKNDPTVQIQTIQQWTELGQVDAIWVIPVAGEAIAPALEDATAAGIVVIAGGFPSDFGFDGPMPGISFSAIDNVEFGKGIGDMMADCVNERLDGTADIIYVGPNVPSETTDNINESSHEALAAGAPDASIVQELVAGADQAATQQMIESALQGNPDSDAFMAGDAEATMAGLNAYTGAGKDPSAICVVGSGGTEDQIASIDAGELYGTVAFDFEGDLTQNVDQLHRMASDPAAEGPQLTVPIKIISG